MSAVGSFFSDNEGTVAAPIMQALQAVNVDAVHSYGEDPTTAALEARLRDWFERDDLQVFPVVTGTAANALAAAQLVPPYGALYCQQHAHVNTDECGAPEFYTAGAKLTGVDGAHGKIDAQAFARVLSTAGDLGVHEVRPSALTLTQGTELGTVYTQGEVQALADLARGRGLGVHMDGARFANALVHLGCSPADITWRLGVDMLSLGATKNGAMAAEALITFGGEQHREALAYRRKRAGHLLSKQRYVSAQLLAWLEDDLWRELAARANRGAQRLSAGLDSLPGVTVAHPTQINEVFAVMPPPLVAGLHEQGFGFYDWPGGEANLHRLVVRWDTPDEHIDALLDSARRLVE
ncbi:MAG: beta-eliminating lyase-related protein [Pseudomonadota bacterium]